MRALGGSEARLQVHRQLSDLKIITSLDAISFITQRFTVTISIPGDSR